MIWYIYHYVIHFKTLILYPLWVKFYNFADHAQYNLLPYFVVLQFCVLYLIILHIVRHTKVIKLNSKQHKALMQFLKSIQQ